MTIRLLFALGALAALAGAVYASTGDCDCGGGTGCGTGVWTVPIPGATLYLDDRGYVTGNGIWLYEETNGIAGLERGGCSPYVQDTCEICVDDPTILPDQLIL